MGAPADGFTSPEVFDSRLTFAAFAPRLLPMLVPLFVLMTLLLGCVFGALGASGLGWLLALVISGAVAAGLTAVKKRQFDDALGKARLELSPAGATVVAPHRRVHLAWDRAGLGAAHLANPRGGMVVGPTLPAGVLGTLLVQGSAALARGRRQPALVGVATVSAGGQTGSAQTAIVLGVYDRDWYGGRIGAWIRAYRPDLFAGGQQPAPPPSAPAPGTVRSATPERPNNPKATDHPVFRLRAGMDRDTVLARLGPPPRSTTGTEALAQYRNAVVGDASTLAETGNTEAWLYPDSVPDHDIFVALSGGVLERVEIARKETGKGRIVIAQDGVHASTPGHAFLMLTAMLDEMPAIDPARLQREYADARQSWHEAPGKVGLLTTVAKLVLDDLEGDAALPGHLDFLLTSMPDRACVQVVSIIDRPGQAAGTGIAYRAWHMADGIQWALIRSMPRNAQR
jgi:hypothetical protein